MIHTIDPGYFCGPSAIQAITGADMQSVVLPAIHRINGSPWLSEEVIETRGHIILMVLVELGYRTLRYRHESKLGTVGSWGDRYPEDILLLYTREHVVVAHNGLIFDNFTPMGKIAQTHPFATIKVTDAYIIRRTH